MVKLLRVFRRPSCLSHAANAVCSRWLCYAASASAVGRFSITSRSRRWLNQWTHSSVANSTGSRPRYGPRGRITAVLYNSMIELRQGRYRTNHQRTQPTARCRARLGVRYCGWTDISPPNRRGGPRRREDSPSARTAPARADRAPSRCEASSTPAGPRCAARMRFHFRAVHAHPPRMRWSSIGSVIGCSDHTAERSQLNMTALSACVVARTSVSRGADAAVGAFFSATADALASCETVTNAGFGTFSTESRPPPYPPNASTLH